MSSLLDARDAYEQALKQYGPLQGVNVHTHGGTFSQQELERYSKASPAVVLALLAFTVDTLEGYLKASAQWGIICIAEDKPGHDKAKDRRVVEIASLVSTAILTNWADLNVEFRPQQIENTNMFGTALDRIGAAMWGLEFSSSFEITDPAAETAVPFTTLGVKWDLAPRDGDPMPDVGEIPEAEDEVDLSP